MGRTHTVSVCAHVGTYGNCVCVHVLKQRKKASGAEGGVLKSESLLKGRRGLEKVEKDDLAWRVLVCRGPSALAGTDDGVSAPVSQR